MVLPAIIKILQLELHYLIEPWRWAKFCLRIPMQTEKPQCMWKLTLLSIWAPIEWGNKSIQITLWKCRDILEGLFKRSHSESCLCCPLVSVRSERRFTGPNEREWWAIDHAQAAVTYSLLLNNPAVNILSCHLIVLISSSKPRSTLSTSAAVLLLCLSHFAFCICSERLHSEAALNQKYFGILCERK